MQGVVVLWAHKRLQRRRFHGGGFFRGLYWGIIVYGGAWGRGGLLGGGSVRHGGEGAEHEDGEIFQRGVTNRV